jgi:hypothetical protein
LSRRIAWPGKVFAVESGAGGVKMGGAKIDGWAELLYYTNVLIVAGRGSCFGAASAGFQAKETADCAGKADEKQGSLRV